MNTNLLSIKLDKFKLTPVDHTWECTLIAIYLGNIT